MKKTKQKILFLQLNAALLFLAAIFPFMMVTIFWYNQVKLRISSKEKLENARLTMLGLKDQEFFWVEEGEEIMVGNQLFDIKKMETRDGITIFWGIFDDEETELVENWSKLQGKQHQQSLFEQAGILFLMMGQSEKIEPIHLNKPEVATLSPQPGFVLAGLLQGFSGQLFRPPSFPA